MTIRSMIWDAIWGMNEEDNSNADYLRGQLDLAIAILGGTGETVAEDRLDLVLDVFPNLAYEKLREVVHLPPTMELWRVISTPGGLTVQEGLHRSQEAAHRHAAKLSRWVGSVVDEIRVEVLRDGVATTVSTPAWWQNEG